MAKTPDATRSVHERRPSAGQPRAASGQTTRRARAAAKPAGDEPVDESAPALPSSLGLDQRPSAARSGRTEPA